MEDKIIEQLIRSPTLRLYYDRIHAILEAEQRRRQWFYERVQTGEKKAEFINGNVVDDAPALLRQDNARFNLTVLLGSLVRKHKLGYVPYRKVMVSLSRNDYRPDICFFGRTKAKTFVRGQTTFPAPDLVVEVLSPGTETINRDTKCQDYAAHGVREYWILDAEGQMLEQYQAQESCYRLRCKARTGSISSVVLPDFVIPVRAIFDHHAYMTTLQRILSGTR